MYYGQKGCRYLYINLRKTLNQIENALPPEGVQDVIKLQKAYELTLRLRSQIIGVIYDMKQYGEPTNSKTPNQKISSHNKQVVTLIIPEPLPGMKELTGAVAEHWATMIHNVIEKESITGIPKFQKAMVMIEITTPRGTDNPRVWDTSNRAVNLIINNLKGIFFRDDDFEHMAFSVVTNWGEIGTTTIRICELPRWDKHPFLSKNDEIL